MGPLWPPCNRPPWDGVQAMRSSTQEYATVAARAQQLDQEVMKGAGEGSRGGASRGL